MEFGYLICLLWLIVCLVSLRDHNKKLEEIFPDHGDQRQNEKRNELTISFYSFGLLALMLIGLFINSIVRG